MNIFIKEFKTYLIPLIVWLVSLSAIHFVASIEFEIFASDPSITEAMAQFEDLFAALGSPVTDITTPIGFISLLSIYITLPLAIYSGLLGSSIISTEEKNKTAEFLFTLPVSRKRVLTSKLILAITNTVIINVFLMSLIAAIYSQFDPGRDFFVFLMNIGIGTLLIQLIFMSIGVALSSVLKYYKQSGSITIVVLITTFMLNMLMGFVDDIDFVKYFTPFKYYSAEAMIDGTYEAVFLVLTVGLIAGGISTLFLFYPKRDLYI